MAKSAEKIVPMVDPMEEEQKAYLAMLERVRGLKGYKAAAIMTFTGELLASDTVDANIDLDVVGTTFNDIFRSAHEASSKIGLEACQETVITTPEGFVIMRCSGSEAEIHFHLMVFLGVGGNPAMAKMELSRLEPRVLEHLVG